MLELRTIEPISSYFAQSDPNIFVPFPDTMVATEGMEFGRMYLPNLIGPTPINLVPEGVSFALTMQPLAPLSLSVMRNAQSQVGENWVIRG